MPQEYNRNGTQKIGTGAGILASSSSCTTGNKRQNGSTENVNEMSLTTLSDTLLGIFFDFYIEGFTHIKIFPVKIENFLSP